MGRRLRRQTRARSRTAMKQSMLGLSVKIIPTFARLTGQPWWHKDRALKVRGDMPIIPEEVTVLQGLYYLESEGGADGASLWVVPGSHRKSINPEKEHCRHNVQLKSLAEHGLAGKQVKLDIPANSLVLFDSRLVHMGGRSKPYKKRKASPEDAGIPDDVAPVKRLGLVDFRDMDEAAELFSVLGYVVLTGVYSHEERASLRRALLQDVRASCEAAAGVEHISQVTPGMLEGSPVKGMTNGALCFGSAMWNVRACPRIRAAFAKLAGYGDERLCCCLNTVQFCANATDAAIGRPGRVAFGITWMPARYRSEEQRLKKLAAAALQVKGTTHWAHYAECGTWVYNTNPLAKGRPTGEVVQTYKCKFHPVAQSGAWLPEDADAATLVRRARDVELQGSEKKYGEGHAMLCAKGVDWLTQHLPSYVAKAM